MRFSNEMELFDLVQNSYNRFIKKLEKVNGKGFVSELLKNDSTKMTIMRKEDQTYYLVGETHLSFKPILYVHNDIVPLIMEEPKKWQFLIELAEPDYIANLKDDAECFYFQKLANMFSIKIIDPIENLDSENVRNHLEEKIGVTNEDMDKWRLTQYIALERELFDYAIGTNNDDMVKAFVHYIADVHFKKPKDYIEKIFLKGKSDLDPDDLLPVWNEYLKSRLQKIKNQFRDKENILVNVGSNHLDIFY